LVLENCDDDYTTPPFEDAVSVCGSDARLGRKVGGLNICETTGGCRALSVSTDGASFLVCENVGHKLTTYETGTGKRLWSLDGEFRSGVFSPEGTVYALTSKGTAHERRLVSIDSTGRIVREAEVAGFDIAMDADHAALWLVGADIKKCDLGLNVLFAVNPLKWCAVSVDVCADGSAWVAEREHLQVPGSKNRLLRISATGAVLKTVDLDWSPFCVRVDRSDGSVWVSGKGFRKILWWDQVWPRTRKYDGTGSLLLAIDYGGHSIDLDRSDGSVWIAGTKKLYHYSASGAKLSEHIGTSACQKYVAVTPPRRTGN
jgi:hypothetical protein